MTFSASGFSGFSDSDNESDREVEVAVTISDDLADFMDVEHGDKVSFQEAWQVICKYIRTHNLSDPKNVNIFRVDEKLKKLLGEARYLNFDAKPELGVGYSYFNLETYLFNKGCFPGIIQVTKQP